MVNFFGTFLEDEATRRSVLLGVRFPTRTHGGYPRIASARHVDVQNEGKKERHCLCRAESNSQ